jgi:hypothetical protein
MKERRPGTDKHVTGMGYFRYGPYKGKDNSRDSRGIDNQGLFNKTDMRLTAGQLQKAFQQVGNDTVAQSTYAYGAHIPDQYHFQQIMFRPVLSVQGGGGHGAQGHMRGMQDIKYTVRDMGRMGQQAGPRHYDNDGNAGNSPEGRKRRMFLKLCQNMSDHLQRAKILILFLMKTPVAE